MSEGTALLSYIRRFENINEQIAELKLDKSEIAAEAKSSGYDMKAIGILLKERAADPEVQKQQDLIVDLYRRRIAEAEHETEMKARAPSDETTEDLEAEEAGKGKRKARDRVAA